MIKSSNKISLEELCKEAFLMTYLAKRNQSSMIRCQSLTLTTLNATLISKLATLTYTMRITRTFLLSEQFLKYLQNRYLKQLKISDVYVLARNLPDYIIKTISCTELQKDLSFKEVILPEEMAQEVSVFTGRNLMMNKSGILIHTQEYCQWL